MEVRVSGVEQPAFTGLDRNPSMSFRVASQWDHQDFRWQAIELAHGIEPEPRLATVGIGAPVTYGVPLSRPIALFGDETPALPKRRFVFDGQNMHAGLRKVLDPAGVVEVEMRQHDVADIARCEAERFDLAYRRITLAKANVQDGGPQPRQAGVRMTNIMQTISGVDQDESLTCFDQNAMGRDVSEHSMACTVKQPAA